MMATQFPSFESRTVTIDGVNIHYVCGGSGPPLVLVHGLGSSAAVEFYYNLEPLAAHHRVIAIDLPGFGKSDKPVLDYTIDLFVKAVRELMTSEGIERAAVMGVSMGGRVALGLALDSPEKVDRLVLVDALGVGAPRRVLADTIWSDERIAHHGTLLATPEYRAAYLSALRSIAGMRQLRDGVVVEDRLPEVRMPTLLIWGGHDHIFPASHAQAAKERIPNARLEVFGDSGHTPQMEEPERFNRLVLDFLRQPA